MIFAKVPKWLEKHRLFVEKSAFLGGGDKRDRTADLLNAIQALSQLSYTPIFSSLFSQLLHYSKVRMFCQGGFSFFFFVPVLLHENANLHPRIKRRVMVIH